MPRRPKAPDTERRGQLRKHLLTSADERALLKASGGACAICGRPRKGRFFHADHDHATGAPRGLLCFDCNVGLGHFGDSPERLRAAASYLEDPPARTALETGLEWLERSL